MRMLVLGGYGGTGRAFCRHLLKYTEVDLVVAGRRLDRAEAWAAELRRSYDGSRIAVRHVDASDPASLTRGFSGIDFLLVAATTTAHAQPLAEAALDAGLDHLDIYYQQDVYPTLQTLRDRITAAGRCFITQAGFHPGMPATLVRQAAPMFDTLERAVVAFGMNAPVDSHESLYELVDALADYKADVLDDGTWRPATWRDMVTVDLGPPFGRRPCYPLEMAEIRALPELTGVRSVGVYAAGFNWFVDNVVFPGIMLSQMVRKGALRTFWAKTLVWGLNTFSMDEPGVVLLVDASGTSRGRPHTVRIRCAHPDAYDFTVIPVVAALRQYLDGTIRRPGLWMMGHLVDPARLFDDMRAMGVTVDITTSADQSA